MTLARNEKTSARGVPSELFNGFTGKITGSGPTNLGLSDERNFDTLIQSAVSGYLDSYGHEVSADRENAPPQAVPSFLDAVNGGAQS